MKRRMAWVAAIAIAACGTWAPAAPAAIFHVDTDADVPAGNGADCADADAGTPCSVRDALAAAAATGEDDRVEIPAGTYVLSGTGLQTQGASGVTLGGAGAGLTTLDADDLSGVLVLDADTTIEGMTIRGGNATRGGGIRATLGTLVLRQSVVEDNRAVDGGGISVEAPGASAIEHSLIRDNRADSQGGGIWTQAGSELTLADSTVASNRAEPAAGGSAAGGGILAGGHLDLTRAAITGNVAAAPAVLDDTAGGGGVVALARLAIRDSALTGNLASGTNGAAATGGGLYLAGPEPHSVRGSTLAANTVTATDGSALGGGIRQFTSSLELVNSTLSGNGVTAAGSALFARGGGASLIGATLINVTMIGNTAAGNGAAAGALDAHPLDPVTLRNTIVAASAPAECDAPVSSATNSIDGGTSCGLPAGGGNRSGVDPLVGPLASNGGTTQTHALLPGSPAVDAGTATGAPATDQRGVARPLGGAFDVGAFELDPGPPAPPPPPPPPPGAGPPAADTAAPVFTDGLTLSRRAFRTRTAVRYALSEPAAVRFTVSRRTVGRRIGGRCVKRTARNVSRRRCIRHVRLARRSFSHAGAAGANLVRLRARGLAPGRYRLVATATDTAGNRSTPSSAVFRILRRRET